MGLAAIQDKEKAISHPMKSPTFLPAHIHYVLELWDFGD